MARIEALRVLNNVYREHLPVCELCDNVTPEPRLAFYQVEDLPWRDHTLCESCYLELFGDETEEV